MTKLGSVGSVGYQKPGLWEVNANLIEHLIQIRFLWFFIPILPDLILLLTFNLRVALLFNCQSSQTIYRCNQLKASEQS